MKWKWAFIVPVAMVGIVLVTFIGGEVVRLLWNWLLPPLFGWHPLTFWQALALLVLCRLLFGGQGLLSSRRYGSRRGMRDRISQRMSERWERMTLEERERFREGIRSRCGFDGYNVLGSPFVHCRDCYSTPGGMGSIRTPCLTGHANLWICLCHFAAGRGSIRIVASAGIVEVKFDLGN